MNTYSKTSFINNLSDLLESQRSSFYHFIYKTIGKELSSWILNPFIVIDSNFENILENNFLKNSGTKKQKNSQTFLNSSTSIYLYPSKIKIKGPLKSFQSCLKKEETYSGSIYIQGEIIFTEPPKNFISNLIKQEYGSKELAIRDSTSLFKFNKLSLKKYFYLTTLPFLTEDGTFYVNGCERVVVNQLTRSPGIYFKKSYDTFQKPTYTAALISKNWAWTHLKLESTSEENKELSQLPKKYNIYVDFNNGNLWKDIFGRKKIFLLDILIALGFSLQDTFDLLKYTNKIDFENFTKNSILLKDEINSFKNIQENKLILDTPEIENIFKRFYGEIEEKAYFLLGPIGRENLNNRLGLSLPLSTEYLTGIDFIKIIDKLIELAEDNLDSDDIDNISNKQLKGVGSLMEAQLQLAFSRWLNSGKDFYVIEHNKKHLFYKNFLLKSSLKYFSFAESFRFYINKTFREFFLTSQLSQYFDQTNPLAELSQKRRISVFGPNGLQRSKISSKIRDIHFSQYGKICPIETPEGENAGLIMSLSAYTRVNQNRFLESPYILINSNGQLLDKTKIFYLNSLKETKLKIGFISDKINKNAKILQKIVPIKTKNSFSESKPNDLDFVTLSPMQIISIGTALVPFIEHDDANRALMGSNMQRQSIPLIFPSTPFIGTGFENSVPIESNSTIKSEIEGIIEKVSSTSIILRDINGQKLYYNLTKYLRSNQETFLNQKPIFWPGEKVYAGQIIGDGSSSINGELALGTNLIVGYLPWEGFNYEDAIVISDSLIAKNILSSIQITKYEMQINPDDLFLGRFSLILKSQQKYFNFLKKLKILKKLSTLNTSKNIKFLIKNLSKSYKKYLNDQNIFYQKFGFFIKKFENEEISKDFLNPNILKNSSYIKRNLSTTGIVKIGSFVKGGDILISKLKVFNNNLPKSRIEKFFEELEFKNLNENLFSTKQKKLIGSFSSINEKTKNLKNLFYLIEQLTFTYIKINTCINKLGILKYSFQKFEKQFTIKNRLSFKILILKYKQKIKKLNFLIKELHQEILKNSSVNILLRSLLKVICKNIYKKIYTNFLLSFNKFQNKKNSTKTKKFIIFEKIKKNASKNIFNIKALSKKKENKNYFNLFINSLSTLEKVSFFKNNPKLLNYYLFNEKMVSVKNIKNSKETNVNSYKEQFLELPLGRSGKVIDIKVFNTFGDKDEIITTSNNLIVKIFIGEHQKIQIGDKLSGRHGNKGVISTILPKQDMPILPDGTPVDILLNPLGVPSRMNVGQLLESLLGLSSLYLGNRFIVRSFDEIFGLEASNVLVSQKLKEASLKSKKDWLYNEECPGKIYLRDGRTGEYFDNPINVGVAYILKLIHLVNNKIHARATGPYNKVTEQPLRGKSAHGGQRFGEMEVWALQAYGSTYTLQELLTIKSDDIEGRHDTYSLISNGDIESKPTTKLPETFIALVREINALGLDFQFFKKDFNALNSSAEVDLFKFLEKRLNLKLKIETIKLKYPEIENILDSKINNDKKKLIL